MINLAQSAHPKQGAGASTAEPARHTAAPSDSAVGADVLVLSDKSVIARDVVLLSLRRPDGTRLPDWTPGAHIDLVLPDGSTRQYSLCGDPRDAYEYRIAVLREADGNGGSRFVHDSLQVGDAVRFGGPRNNFRLVPADRYLFIAGGIGITPILPMLRAADALGAEWSLLYCGRDAAGMAFGNDLAEAGDGVRLHVSLLHGRADLPEWVGDFRADTKLYACGPEEFIDAIRAATTSWPRGWVRFERFTATTSSSPARTTAFEVEVDGTDQLVHVEPGVSVATALRDAGFDILTSCSRGVCGTCETRVLAGEPDHRDSILDDDERADATTFFPCVSRARTDRLTLAL